MSLDDNLIAALRAARHHHLGYLIRSYMEHRQHETFRVQDWPYSREMGFTCGCSGVDREWRVSLTALREALPAARATFMRMRVLGGKVERQKRTRADKRAKALLYRFLSREQKWELRSQKSFTVSGGDNRVYRVTWGSCNNVKLLENGKPRYSLCLVSANGYLPIADLLLAQKVLLEMDPDRFLRTAQVYDLETKAIFKNGAFLAEGKDPPVPNEVTDEVQELPVIPNEVLDDPRQWLEERLREA